MFSITKQSIDGGSAAYWADRKEAFRLIRQAEYLAAKLDNVLLYIHGGYDADGEEIIIENMAPFTAFEDALQKVEANTTAFNILVAQKRTAIGGQTLHTVMRHLRSVETY